MRGALNMLRFSLLTVAYAGAFVLATTPMSLAQQSTPPISPQIDTNPWIPPEPPDDADHATLHKLWANLVKPGVKHLRAVPHKDPSRTHNFSSTNWSGMVTFPDGYVSGGSGNLYTTASSSAAILFQVPSAAAPSTGCSGGGDGTACGVTFWVGFGGADDSYVTQAGFDTLIDPAGSTPLPAGRT
jgi:hypothetical protein